MFSPLGSLFEIPLPYQLLAARCLRDSTEGVARALGEGGLVAGRKAVSYIVGRNTEALGEAGVIRATVEMVVENVSDGEVVPLFYLPLFGVTGGWVHKTVNTVGSMLGYKNARYELFGRVAARMDDTFSWIPARITTLLLIAVAAITGRGAGEAARILRRDRHQHVSPDPTQAESAVAGALGVRLTGPASYFGERKEKPYIGDAGREVEAGGIAWVNRMLTAVSWLSLFSFLVLRFFCCTIVAKLAVSL